MLTEREYFNVGKGFAPFPQNNVAFNDVTTVSVTFAQGKLRYYAQKRERGKNQFRKKKRWSKFYFSKNASRISAPMKKL